MTVQQPSEILSYTAHRPWPLPTGHWIMTQTWNTLLFAHWPVSVDALLPLIPSGLMLDTFEDQAWIGVIPFYLNNMRLRAVPPIPGVNAFHELNLRTYVTVEGKPGIWFFSLDAANAFAVWGARQFFHLPYFRAFMSSSIRDSQIHYTSHRANPKQPTADFEATYHPLSSVYHAQPGTLVHWFTERYCLYSADQHGRLYRGEIHHVPWPLQDAEALIHINTISQALPIELLGEPLLHYAEQQDVLVWPIYPLGQ